MRIWTWRPFDPLGELQRQVDRLFDFTVDKGRQLWQSWRQFPALNLYETPTEYLLAAPVPGTRPEDIDITVTGNHLTIKGERKRTGDVPEESYRREERWLGKWSRSIQVPDRADLSSINATMENGILLVHMPKTPESQPRQVPVKLAEKA